MQPKEVQQLLKVTRQRVNVLATEGRILCDKRPGGAIFFRASVEAFAKIERTNRPLTKEGK